MNTSKRFNRFAISIIMFTTLIVLNYFFNVNEIGSTNYNDTINDNDLNRAGYWDLTGTPILIDDLDPARNWSKTTAENDWCTGLGTIDEPYILENITIDSGTCLEIRNSNQNFIIRNCTFYRSGGSMGSFGIKLDQVNNGIITNNIFLPNVHKNLHLYSSNNIEIVDNNFNGDIYAIWLEYSNNNIIANNTLNDYHDGIKLETSSHNNNVTDNTLTNIGQNGISISGSNNLFERNIMDRGGINIGGTLQEQVSLKFDMSNLVNGRPIYYYANKKDLMPYNFTDAAQVRLINCSDSFISNLNITNVVHGIALHYCNNITVLNSVFSNNIVIGVLIKLSSNNNVISENIIRNSGDYGIYFPDSSNVNNLVFKNNITGNRHNAYDYGTNTSWDNGSIGNYWDDYPGPDLNDDGIGDIPYEIPESLGSKDYFPIYNDGDLITSIYINDLESGPSARNWEWASTAPWCTGSGTWNDPYIIENLTLTVGLTANLIDIRNSNKYFIIQNCTLHNSPAGFGNRGAIKLVNVSKGIIKLIEIAYSGKSGIALEFCDNISIFDNDFIDNPQSSVYVGDSTNINISQNEAKNEFYLQNSNNVLIENNIVENSYNYRNGVHIAASNCHDNTIKNNSFIDCGIYFEPLPLDNFISFNISTDNLVNGKSIYFFKNELNLNQDNFSNPGQIILVNCSRAKISNFNIFKSSAGISLYYSNNNYISNCILTENQHVGIDLYSCVNNTFSNCSITNNIGDGIFLDYCQDTVLLNNYVGNNRGSGIVSHYSVSTNYTGNIIDNNDPGIFLFESDYSIFKLNTFYDNNWHELQLRTSSNNNNIFNNFFIGSSISVLDECSNNNWDNGSIGNFWSNYGGIDDNDDGIGDTPQLISGSGGSIDHFPIWNDGFNGIPIYIDALATGIDAHNWTWASKRFWCTGSGSYRNPYVISNLIIDANNNGYGILIENSNSFFKIENCTIYNSGSGVSDGGIKLYSTNNGIIEKNNVSNNNWDGIRLENNCKNNTVFNNKASNNNNSGISLYSSSNNTILENTANNNGNIGVYLSGSHHNIIKENLANNNIWHGSAIEYSYNNTILGNIVNGNNHGFFLRNVVDTDILKNTANNNGITGIYLLYNSNNNTISGNNVYNNFHFGLRLIDNSNNNTIIGNIITSNDFGIYFENSENNLILGNYINGNSHGINLNDVNCILNRFYNNTLISNGIHARDDGSNNYWDNGHIGNYWDDYGGKDINDDGIGDSPYNIDGLAGSEDNLPIWWDPPAISINFPLSNDLFGKISPEYNISIDEGIMHSLWYILNDTFISNLTFNSSGTIDQGLWNNILNGTVSIKFFINDSRGYISSVEVVVRKDVIAPVITVNFPYLNSFFTINAPNYDLTIFEKNMDSIWYRLSNGTVITGNMSIEMLNGLIDQNIWDLYGNGTVIIQFFANDTLGNIGYSEVFIRKDIVIPIVVINMPNSNDLYGTNVPSYNISIIEVNLQSIWYRLNNGTLITLNVSIFSLYGSIDQYIWNQVGNGTIKIQFYVRDTAGNIGYSEIVVRKEVTPPIIMVNLPAMNELFSFNFPSYNISIIEENLDSIWYRLNNGTLITDFIIIETLYGSIEQNIWDQVGNGTIIIQFYANDTLGNIGYSEMIIRKDILAPIITIIRPISNEVFGTSAPPYDIMIEEGNLEAFWYTIENGSLFIRINNYSGFINQTFWDSLPEGRIIIRFHANDTFGQSTFKEIIIYKVINNDFEELFKALSPIIITIIISALGVTIITITIKAGAFTKLKELLSKTLTNKEEAEEILTESFIRKDGLLYCPNCHSKIDFGKDAFCTNCGHVISKL